MNPRRPSGKAYLWEHQRVNILVFTGSMLFSGLLSVYLGQDANWDLKNYHFYNPHAFLHGRLCYDIAPAQRQSFLNPLLDLPSYLMMQFLPPIIFGFVIGALQGLNLWLIYKLAFCMLRGSKGFERQAMSILAGVTGYCGAANLSEIGTTFNDNITSLFIVASMLIAVSQLIDGKERTGVSHKVTLLCGFLAGFAAGLKLTAAIYCLPLVFCWLFVRSRWQIKATSALLCGLGTGIGFITAAGFWSVTLWQRYHNPLFPFYNNVFRSPLAEPASFGDPRFLPRDIYQALFYPFYFIQRQNLVSELTFRDARLAVCFALLLILLAVMLYRRVMSRRLANTCYWDISGSSMPFLIIFFVAAYILWQGLFSIYRYTVPLELLSPVFIIAVLPRIFSSKRVISFSVVTIFLLLLFTTVPPNWGRVSWSASYFGVVLPNLEDMDRSIVVTASDDPLSYVIPSFPPGARFFGLNSNLTNPSSRSLLQRAMREALKERDKCIYLLYREKSETDYGKILAHYGLRFIRSESVKLQTRLDNDLSLVPLRRN